MTAPPQISTLSPYTTLFRSKGGGRGGRQPPPREGGKKKGRPAVQAGRVRHHLRRRNLLGRDRPRRGPRAEDRPEVGLLLQLRGRAARPGAPERDRVPPGASGYGRGDPASHSGADRRRVGRLLAAPASGRRRARARPRGGGGRLLGVTQRARRLHS